MVVGKNCWQQWVKCESKEIKFIFSLSPSPFPTLLNKNNIKALFNLVGIHFDNSLEIAIQTAIKACYICLYLYIVNSALNLWQQFKYFRHNKNIKATMICTGDPKKIMIIDYTNLAEDQSTKPSGILGPRR